MSSPANPPRSLKVTLFALALAQGCSGGPAEDTRGSQPPPPVSASPDTAQAAEAAEPPALQAKAAPAEPEAPPVPTFGPAKLTALDEAQLEILRRGEEDDPISVDIHYIQSNEGRHDLFFEYIDNVGGAFVGVASDPGYTLMARARSELAFMMDIDYRVVDLHHMYRVFILEAETPEDLYQYWNPKNSQASQAFLEEKLTGEFSPRRVARIKQGYRAGRETVWRYLTRVIKRQRDGEPSTWLSDPDNYAHVRALYQTKRLRIMHGDLTGAKSLQGIATALKELEVPLRVLYMSNAEEYFKYTKQFRENMRAQPTDDTTVILRTIYSKKWEHADLWAYQVQPMTDFLARLDDWKKSHSRGAMLKYAQWNKTIEMDTGIKGFTRLGFGEHDQSKVEAAE